MTYAYIRVSTDKQTTENQEYEILKYAQDKNLTISPENMIRETISSRKDYQVRELGNLMDFLESGDELITTELSRLGRSLLEVMEILHQLMKKDVKVHVTKMKLIIRRYSIQSHGNGIFAGW